MHGKKLAMKNKGRTKTMFYGVISSVVILFLGMICSAEEKVPNVYLRFKILSPSLPVYCEVSSLFHHFPFAASWLRPIPRSGADYPQRWIKPDEYSPWVEITDLLAKNKKKGYFGTATVSLSFHSNVPIENIKVQLDISNSPDEKYIIKSLIETIDGKTVGVIIPWDIVEERELIETVSSQSQRHYDFIKSLDIDNKNLPKKFIIETGCVFWPSKKIAEQETGVLKMMGFNSVLGADPELALEHGVSFLGKVQIALPDGLAWAGCDNPCNLKEKINKTLLRLPKNKQDNMYAVKLRDEPCSSLFRGHIFNCPACTQAFREYLKEKDFSPLDFGQENWNAISPIKKEGAKDLVTRKLYYYTVKFANHSVTNVFKLATSEVEKHFSGEHILTTTSFTPHQMLKGGMKYGSPDWFEIGKARAVTLLESSDWLSDYGWFTISNEFTSYILSLLRASVKYHQQPISLCVTEGNGISTRQKTYSALSNGAKMIHYYGYGPAYNKEDYGSWSDNKDRVKEIAKLTREIGKVEDILLPAHLRPAETAILYSLSSDIWEKPTEPYILERRYVHLALLHDQVPVDFITEEDIIEDYLRNYKVLYLIGPNIMNKAAGKVKDWVNAGGVLFVDCGSAIKDEYNQENKILYEVMGITAYEIDIREAAYAAGGRDGRIMGIQPIGKLNTRKTDYLNEMTINSFGCRQYVALKKGAEVLGRFTDGVPGIILNDYGKGKCFLITTLPGLGYIRGSNFTGNAYTTEYPAEERAMITSAVKLAHIRKPVELSHPIIEASLLESSEGETIILNNYTVKSIDSLTVKIRDIGDFKSIESLVQGSLKYKNIDGGIELSMPLGFSDMIIIRN